MTMVSLLVALVVTLACMKPAILLAWRAGAVDRADPAIRTHDRDVPLLGGVAIILGLGAGLMVADIKPAALSLFGCAVLAALGLYKDLNQDRLSPLTQLCIQVPGCAALAAGAIEDGNSLNLLAATLFAVFIVNAVNLLDVSDGLASSVVAMMGAALASAFAIAGGPVGVALATAGASLGFFAWNAPKARVFMGDLGSYGLGSMVAWLLLSGWQGGLPVIALILIAAVPILDFAAIMLTRLVRGRSLLVGDLSHPSLILLNRGGGPWTILALVFALGAAGGAAGLLITRISQP